MGSHGIWSNAGIRNWVAGLLLFSTGAPAQEPKQTNETHSASRKTPATLASAFQIKPGFRIESVTPESMVSSPVAMAFDENGRLFVAEMRDYPDRRAQNPHLGRVRLLEDADGDG